MEPIVMQKIYEGDTGAMAAIKILNNDTKLLNAVTAIKDELEAYGHLINLTVEVESGGTPITIALVQYEGHDPEMVMSQKAVTEYVEEQVDGDCKIGAEITSSLQMPESGDYVNVWVSRASSNAQGHSLTTLYNDVEDLKHLYQTTGELMERMRMLEDRVSVLEAKQDGY